MSALCKYTLGMQRSCYFIGDNVMQGSHAGSLNENNDINASKRTKRS